MATAKNYPLYKELINSLLMLAGNRGWRVITQKEILHGYQIVVTDGIMRNNVDIFPSGKVLVQGQPGNLRNELLAWRAGDKNLSENMIVAAETQPQPALIEIQEAPAIKASPATKEKTVAEHMTGFARVAINVAGKDDYFGPLVVSAIYIDAWIEAQLVMLGVLNTLSDEQIILAAERIRDIAPFAIVAIGNKNYNDAFSKVQDKDKLLAWSYARVIEQLLEKVSCHTVVASSFSDESIIQNALTKKNHRVTLRQVLDQSEVGIASASILARAEFVQRMARLSTQMGITLPVGSLNPSIITVEREIVAKGGQTALSQVAKLHVRMTEKVLKS
ncbi:MAG: ribonuclease HIII [Ktedonobacteraceae bacterium]